MTLVDVLRERAHGQPDQRAYTFLNNAGAESAALTYGQLDAQARAIGARLQEAVIPGERALLLFPPGLEFVAAFLGCLYAGVIAVPAYPPQSSRMLPRILGIAQDARPAAMLTTAGLLPKLRTMTQASGLEAILLLATDSIDPALAETWKDPGSVPGDLAFLQYTSGSTASPKGVMVSHGNLLHNEAMISAAFGLAQGSVIAGWLPLHHDMGLIGNVLQPLCLGATCVLMSPVNFLQQPALWLQAITRYRAVASGGPNFAYDLCVRKIDARQQLDLDLTSWELAYNGAEPVRSDTMNRFARAFAPCGFHRDAFFPCYGLAEATLFVTGGGRLRPLVTETVEAPALERHEVMPADPGSPAARTLVGCGHSWQEQRVAIVDPESSILCAPGRVGEIWVSGPSVAQGYWGNPGTTGRDFRAYLAGNSEGPFLRTGDLGFLRGEELFVTGRLKDLIILRGRNLYPQDLELTAERGRKELRPGCSAAFAVDVEGEERLILACELEPRAGTPGAVIAEAIRQALAQEHEVQPHEIVLLEAGTIPKTTSGKIQRHACRSRYLAGELVVRWQSGQERPAEAESEAAASQPSAADLRRTILESHLTEQAARILRVPSALLDPQKPLTAYGLDSVGAVEVQHELESRLGVAVDLGDLLRGITLRQLAEQILVGPIDGPKPPDRSATVRRPEAGPVPAEVPAAGTPLTYGQRALWFLQRLQPANAAYNIATAVDVRSHLDYEAVRRSLELLTLRHEALRYAFVETPDGPVQRVCPGRTLELRFEDTVGWSRAQLDAHLLELACRPFDLERDPLLRVSVFQTSPGEHTLLLVIHHIISDLWSIALMIQDLGHLYSRHVGGLGEPLPTPNLRFTDYAIWQGRLLASERGEELWAYWREQLRGELPVLDLPTDRPRPPLQTFEGDGRTLALSADLLQRIKALGARHNATLYATLLTAFQVLLHRYGGQDDVLVGSPISARTSAALGEVVGYFANPVVMRTDLSGQPAFGELLPRVRETALAAFAHQDYPFPLLVERLQPERDPSRSPLFQALLVLERAPVRGGVDLSPMASGESGIRIDLGGLVLESRSIGWATAQLDIELLAAETDHGLGMSLIYNSDLFDASTAERLLGSLQALLAGAVDHPERQVSDLPLLGTGERHQLLVEWNDIAGSALETVDDGCLHELFASQASVTPATAAVLCGTSRLTYREIEERSNRLAHHLLGLGVGPETPIGVCLERGPELVPALLAILKAGGTYVPLDPAYPQERLAFLLEDARAPVLVTQTSLASRFGTDATLVLVDGDRDAIAARSAAAPRTAVYPDQLAYLIYTSGSTGRPKGVAITHRNAVALVRWSAGPFTEAELGGVLASTSICFDLSVFELFVPLSRGGLVLIAADAIALAELPAAAEVTLINTVPSAIAELVRLGPPPAALRTVNLAGEPLKRALVQQIERWHPGVRVLNLYGPSEDTTYSTWATVSGDEGTVLIGRPVTGTAAFLLDRHGHPVPQGVPGELHLGGAGLARGYLGRPELTAAKFIPDAFSVHPGGRLYATGDLARLRRDGNLEFLGRIDHQVKIRGFRIEPGEIEAVLAGHAGVEAVAVMPQEAGPDDHRLVAYVVGQPGQEPDLGKLRDQVAQRLPRHMVPSAFVALPALPLTPNGKLDRRALPRPDWEGDEAHGAGEHPDTVPRNPTEERLVALWAELLGVKAGRIGVDTNFFALGGHSLLATRLISRIRQDLRAVVPVGALFQAPTPAALARLVLGILGGTGQGPEAPPVRPAPRTGSLPLSFAQERLWFLDQLEPGSAAYNIPAGVRLRGRLDTRALATSLREIARRHETLRTTFAVDEGRPVQRIALPGDCTLPVVDLAGLPYPTMAACWLGDVESRRGFDLERGPLWRATLLRLSAEEHLLLLVFHHTVMDGWSMGLFARELSDLYSAFAGRLPSPLPELPIQYADFAVWQRKWMSGEVLEGQLAYWRRQLGGAGRVEEAPVLELPTDRPPSRARDSRGASQPLALSEPLTSRLGELARREGITLFMVLLGGFAAVLSRWAGQEDVSIGTAIANRNRTETEGLIGFFANTLVLRADLSGDPSGRDLLARVRELALAAYAHQDLPFERLVQELQPRRDAETLPLFRVALTLGTDPAPNLALAGLSAGPWPLDTGTAKFDLTLQLSESGGGLAGVLEYSTGLFDAPTPRRLIRHFASLLEDLAADPGRPVSVLTLLTPAERHHLLAEWSGASEHPLELTILELFARQVELRPDAVAVSQGELRLTYGELDRRASRLARRLGQLGVGPEVPVGLYLERSLDLAVALVAILKSGGAYVPLDPSHPRERMAFILAQTGAPIVLTWERLRGDLPETARVLCLDGEDLPDFIHIADAPAPAITPESLAYILYTSGSTGEPKGVGVPHRAVVRLVRDTAYASFGPDEVFLQLAPVAFDASTLEVWGPLLNGGRLALAPPGPVTLEELERVIARERVTALWLTAGLFHQMVDQGGLRGLRQLLAGGDVLSPPHVRRALEQLPGCVLVNGYGPTENTTFSCCYRMTWPGEVGTPVPIGAPIARTTVYVVDRAGQPSPANVPGELWVGGDGLARGYVGRPDLTAERFVPHPFGGPGERLYRTGDRVRFLPGGILEFLGRIDQQLKIRGFRIEPGEIEAVLAAHPGVEAVAVVSQEVGPDDRRLVAYVSGQAIDLDELRILAARRLPGYMVPAVFQELPALPLTANGKVDRRALPRPDWNRGEASEVSNRPRNPTEELLVGLWAELLGLEASRVGIDASFFDLGGHSLLATRLISRVREDLRVEVPLHGLFEEPTPAGLARLVLAAREGPDAPRIRPVPRTESLPLSFAQERLWFLDQLEPGSATYNIPAAVRLKGRLDTAALAASLREIVRRHEALRTTFVEEEGWPVQRISPAVPLGTGILPAVDLSGLSCRDEMAQRLVAEESRRGFDLEHGPLWRATLLRLAPEESMLLLNLHHIVADGWSMGVFIRELSALYAAFAAGRPSPLSELQVQYADVAVWQRERLDSGALAAQSAYWKRQLTDLAMLQLPTDRPHLPARSSRGASLAFHLSAETRAGLEAVANRERVTLFMILLGGFQALLSRFADQEDVAIGTAIANRNRAETEDLIGLFVNTLVLRTDLTGDPDRRQLLGRVRQVTLDAYAHQDLPFEKLVEELAPERDLGRSPLVGVLLILQNMPMPELDLRGLAAESLPASSQTARLDLTLSLFPREEGLAGWLEFATDLFDEVTVQRMAAHFEQLLGGLSSPTGGEPRLSTLPLLTAAERAQLLTGRDQLDIGITECLHEAFSVQASATPEAVAVVCGSSQLTYGEIEERANRLAHHLLARGVGAETPVGVCLERGPELVPALLGILKAGGAYVPLDPAYPQERLVFLLEDARVPVLVTQTSLASRFATDAVRVLVDGDRDAIAARGAQAPVTAVDPDQLAYLIYTSGSTGRPKGVAITHRNAMALLGWAVTPFTEADLAGVLASTSICFDLSVFELFVPLSRGGTVLLAADAIALAELPAAPEVTLINTVPSAIAELVRLGPPPAALRTVNLAGEPLQRALVQQIERWHPGVRVLNLYGPSEDTTYSTWAVVSGEEGGVPIGRPVAGTSVYLLDRHGNPVPQGMPGELHLAGAGLARGYLGRPELTAAKFIPDLFASQPGGRLYVTGDLARLRRDGSLEFLGRRDHQVKVRGFRIELGEIETALCGHPAVREAVVLARQEGLAAYLTQDRSADIADISELRSYLQGKLPAHMVPGAFVLLEAFPLSPNGKIDRRALPAPGVSEPAAETGGTAPRGPYEEMVAGVLASALGRERLGVKDDFFELGGHSLLATRVVSRLRTLLGVELPVRQLFETPTVAALAAAIAQRHGDGSGAEPAIVPIPRTGTLPLSFSQERLWFLDRLQPGNASYNLPVAVRLRGVLDPALLACSLAEIVRRHETLRTTFGAVDGQPFQRISERSEVSLPLLDLGGLARPGQDAELDRQIAEDKATPFDLERGPLLRARLLRLADEDWGLLLDLHHIISDGWSLRRLFSELSCLYGAFLSGAPSPLPELEVQYADYAQWQRQWFQGEVLERHLDYWRRQLEGTLPVLDLPTDRLRPAIQTFRGGSRSALLPGNLGADLRALGRKRGSTLFMTMFAAFNLLLHRYSGQDDILVGIPIAGRNRAQIEDLIGFFINSLVLRTDLSGGPSFGGLLARVRQVALDAYAHQDLSFERLLQELRLERDLSRTPLFQVYFNFQASMGALPPMPGLGVESLSGEEELSKFDLTLYVLEESDGQVRLDLVYNAALFSADRCREMLDQYVAVLTQVAAQPDAGIDQVSLLTPRALQLLPDTSQELDAAWIGPVHRHLTAWAARDPERTAVSDPTGAWTYGELEARSNRLAHLLLAHGIQKEETVAIYAHRSATLVWAVLGTLKAGAAFVVVDPAYPPARIVEILRLARPRFWLAMESAGAVSEPLATFVAGLPGCGSLTLPAWNTGDSALDGLPAEDPGVSVGPDDLAYISFTSGSTGMPKGILGRHGPLSHFLPWQCQELGLAASDRFSLLSGLAHDPLQRDIFTPLYLGAKICIPDPAEIVVPGKLSAWMWREQVSVAHLTPAMGQVLTESGPQAVASLPALRYVLLVGDILTRRDAARLRRLAPGVTCVNLYGSTETQRAVGYHVVPPADAEQDGGAEKEVMPLGRGMKDVQLLVRNRAGQQAGIGELGEIAVRSPHLARGYLGDEEATFRKFLVNRSTGLPGDRLYLTGDLGRYLPNGEVAFAGRADTQVKIRGFRIELGEIESQLGRVHGVREAVVLATEDGGANSRLVAFVVPEPGSEAALTAAGLRGHLKTVMPAYMVPTSVLFLPKILLTPNGKVDRRELLRLAGAQREGDAAHYQEPRTQAELRIAGILREVLGVERVGAEDNFFDLGGNSLLLLQVQSRIQAAFDRELPVFELFSNPTVSALARHLTPSTPSAPSGIEGRAAAADHGAEQLQAGKLRRNRRFQQNQRAAQGRPGGIHE